VNFFIGITIAFVTNKLYWFFANMTILIYVHSMSTFPARIISHCIFYIVVCIKGIEN